MVGLLPGRRGKLSRLAFYLDRYGDALEADFAWGGPGYSGGMDLGELWRNGKRRRILNLITQLPQASRFAAAVANDPEHVEAILEATKNDPQKEVSPPLSTWTTDTDFLAQIKDTLEVTLAVLVRANGGSSRKVKPVKRPQTAFADAAEKRTVSQHRKVVERVKSAGSAQRRVE